MNPAPDPTNPAARLVCACSCFDKQPHIYHHEGCPMLDHPETIRLRLTSAEDKIEADRIWSKTVSGSMKRLKELAERWEGKFRKVTHENNQLRKQLYPNK